MTGPLEMSPLIDQLRRAMADLDEPLEVPLADLDVGQFVEETGFVVQGRGRPSVVLGSSVGAELGHPRASSRSFVATTHEPGLVVDGRMTLFGPDLPAIEPGATTSFGQVVLLEVLDGCAPDPFDLENTQLLTNRLPGYMVRSVPGRLWVRISREAIASGMRLRTVATALWAAYHADFAEVTAVEVVYVTSCAAHVEALAPLALEAKARTGQHKKLVLNAEGVLECAEAACTDCDERDVCEAAREILQERRTGRTG